MADDEFGPVGGAALDHRVGARHADSHRFFANDGSGTAGGGGDGESGVQKVPGADADDIGPGLFHHFFDRLELLIDAVFFHIDLASRHGGVANGDNFDIVSEIVAFHVGTAD